METLTANLKIDIPSFKESTVDKNVIFYQINLYKRGSRKWILEKRFSEFDSMHKSLYKLFGKILPILPSKTLFRPKIHEDLDQRRVDLEKYLREIIVRQEIFNSEPVRKFLQIENFASELLVKPPILIEELQNFEYGVRDFIYLPDDSLFFCIVSDMNVLSRMDSYISNTKLPWDREDKPACVASVGALECYIEKKKFEFQKVWAKKFAFQAICMSWNKKEEKIAIGLDDGSIFVGKVEKNYEYLKLEELLIMKVHDARIMGIDFDEKGSSVYTISEDKCLKVTEIFEHRIIYNYAISYVPLTNLRIDRPEKRLIVSNKTGVVFVYDCQKNPSILSTLQTPGKNSIRGLCYDPAKHLVFCGSIDDGEITVFNLKTKGKEKLIKMEASFKSKSEIRVIEWSSSRAEIYAGHADGTITIWDGKKVTPIYVIKNSDSAITMMKYIEKDRLLIVASKSKNINVWELPEYWRDLKVLEEEELDSKIRTKTEKMIDMQKNREVAQLDSDEDELSNFRF